MSISPIIKQTTTADVPFLVGQSPRFDLQLATYIEIETALSDVGHCVLEGVFNEEYIAKLRSGVERYYKNQDELFSKNLSGLSLADIDRHISSFDGFHNIADAIDDISNMWGGSRRRKRHLRTFLNNVKRSRIVSVFQYLFGDEFVVFQSEHCVRRLDPAYPLRFNGVHCDGQLGAASSKGINTQRELTVWAPLQHVMDDNCSRLLLFKRGVNFDEVTFEGRPLFSTENLIEERGIQFSPIQLKPAQILDESDENVQLNTNLIDRIFRSVYQALEGRCYAPKLRAGDVILFERDIYHGSFWHSSMTKPRYSMDFRVTGKFLREKENAHLKGHSLKMGLLGGYVWKER